MTEIHEISLIWLESWCSNSVGSRQMILGQASRLYSCQQNYTTYYLNPKHLTWWGDNMLSLTGHHWLLIRSKMTKSRKREFVIYTSSDLRVGVNGPSWFFFEVFRLVEGCESGLEEGGHGDPSRQSSPVDQDKGIHLRKKKNKTKKKPSQLNDMHWLPPPPPVEFYYYCF